MKPIKMFDLAAIAALLAMAFVGASSAMATGSTALCTVDESPCSAGNIVTHVHETTLSGAKARLLGNPEVKCNVLFLGDALNSGLANPLIIHGNFTYTNCEGGCTVEEENGPTEIKVLRGAAELTTITYDNFSSVLLLHLKCLFDIDCYYVGSGLVGHGLGPLTSSELNGSVFLSRQHLDQELPAFPCPELPELDITTTPLAKTYIST
jgi:hypothetical protein